MNAGVLQLNYLYWAYESTLNLNVSNALAFGATPVTVGGLSGNGDFSLLTTSGTGVNLSVGNNNADATFAGAIAGSNSASALTKLGTGTLTLTGSSTYLGATTISAGTLQVGDGTTDGSITASSGIANSGALVCNVVTAQTIGGVISGTGTLTKNGNGLLTLTAASNSGGRVTTINSGTLQLGDGTSGHDGSLGGGIVNNAALVFNYSGARESDGLISGTGAIIKTGAGTWQNWATASTFTGPVFINAGVVELTYMTATLGSGSSAVTLANTAGAALNLNAHGWGATTVSIGSLSGGGANGGTVDMEGDTFIVGTDNTSTTFAGVLQNINGWGGISTFVKTGTGTLTLTGTNTY